MNVSSNNKHQSNQNKNAQIVICVLFLQVYDDSVEIQKHFMIVRDNVCRNGEGLGFSSPAISYTHRHLLMSVEEQTVRKRQAEETPADDSDQKMKVIIFLFGACLLVSRFWLHTIGN